MKVSSISVGVPKYQPRFTSKAPRNNYQSEPDFQNRKSKFKKALPFVLSATLGLTGLAVGFLIGSKHADKVTSTLGQLKGKEAPLNEKTALALIALAGFGGFMKGELDNKELEEKLDGIIKGDAPSQQALKGHTRDISEIKRTQTNSTVNKHAQYFHDVLLLKQDNVLNRDNDRYQKAIETIETIGLEKLTSTKPLPKIESDIPVIWSITSEFAPVKEGGLGSVPPEVRNNAQRLGVDMPTFVPMYLNEGIATFYENDGEYTYLYKDKAMQLKKMATIQMDVYKNGKSKSIPVTFYLHTDEDKEGTQRQLIFIQAPDYFDGTIYEANAKTEEPEKFAIMSKAVYEFAKLKMEGARAGKNLQIFDQKAYQSVLEPDGMILNDWQASPTAALMRYKAPMEYAYKQLSEKTAQKLRDMKIITIGHNVMYQGSSQNNNDYYQKKATTSNILNTLFDKYAYDIVTHAKSGATSIDPDDKGLEVLDNVLLMEYKNSYENYTNFLNMGIILSDYFNPVSKNYTRELISPEHRDLSYMLQWALVQKHKAGKLVGVINGNDFDNLSIEAKKKSIEQSTGVTPRTYRKTDSLDEILGARLENKTNIYQDFILPYSKSTSCTEAAISKAKKLGEKIEFCAGAQGTTLPVLSKKEIQETPILLSGGRLVSQKGIGVLCDAINMLFENWDKDFPGKNKPIIYIAGSDGEGGSQRRIIEDLKDNRLSKEDNDRILFAHGHAPLPALMAASDFFLMPSLFEPCGLTQGESLAMGTPVIASAVGGIVDTINRDGKLNGILTDKDKPLDAQEYYEALKDGLEIFYNHKSTYNRMVKDSIDEDFSWAKDGHGSVFEYLDLFGIDRRNY